MEWLRGRLKTRKRTKGSRESSQKGEDIKTWAVKTRRNKGQKVHCGHCVNKDRDDSFDDFLPVVMVIFYKIWAAKYAGPQLLCRKLKRKKARTGEKLETVPEEETAA